MIALLLTLVMALSLCACGAQTGEPAEEAKEETAAEETAGAPSDMVIGALSLLNMTEEETKILDGLMESANLLTYGTADMPQGTITTEPYFTDVLVPVELK